jgi:hypothetical protein
LAFSENPEVTKQSVRVLLGTTVSQMTKEELEKIINWYRQLKVQASIFCKDRAAEDLLYSAVQLGVPFKTVEAIKKRWKECKTQAELETMGGVIQQMKKEILICDYQ